MMNRGLVTALAAALALAGCASIPTPRQAAAPASRYQWTQLQSAKAQSEMAARFGRTSLRPGEFVWVAAVPATGETRIVVDLVRQLAFVYRADQLVGTSTISSGKPGHPTPLGYWQVLEKKKFHRSRKYDDAPMPFMQRLDEYGIALHAGAIPGHPASHGCIRLPLKFAERLYRLTKLGSKVVIEG